MRIWTHLNYKRWFYAQPQNWKKLSIALWFCALLFGPSLCLAADETAMALIPGGKFTPLYTSDTTKVVVDSFYLDIYPVTNQQFLAFVRQYPKWQKSHVKPVFADINYLKHWPAAFTFGADSSKISRQPVTHVSWFAAKNYCECQGKHLPTSLEWELVGMASETHPRGAAVEPGFNQRILDWYSKPNPPKLGTVGSTFKNYYGIYDLHGLVWEWVLDFNTAILSGDSRGDSGVDRNLFCAGGSVESTDVQNYAAYMRYAMRASLKADYTTSNLGFRCAKKTPR